MSSMLCGCGKKKKKKKKKDKGSPEHSPPYYRPGDAPFDPPESNYQSLTRASRTGSRQVPDIDDHEDVEVPSGLYHPRMEEERHNRAFINNQNIRGKPDERTDLNQQTGLPQGMTSLNESSKSRDVFTFAESPRPTSASPSRPVRNPSDIYAVPNKSKKSGSIKQPVPPKISGILKPPSSRLPSTVTSPELASSSTSRPLEFRQQTSGTSKQRVPSTIADLSPPPPVPRKYISEAVASPANDSKKQTDIAVAPPVPENSKHISIAQAATSDEPWKHNTEFILPQSGDSSNKQVAPPTQESRQSRLQKKRQRNKTVILKTILFYNIYLKYVLFCQFASYFD